MIELCSQMLEILQNVENTFNFTDYETLIVLKDNFSKNLELTPLSQYVNINIIVYLFILISC